MAQERGYSLVELLVSLGIIGVMSAVAIPLVLESSRRSDLWTGSERMGALIRQTRLKAISQNRTYRVRFDCPAAGQARGLVFQGNPVVDDAANRCTMTVPGDSEVVVMPTGVTVDPDDATELRVTPRGVFTALGDSIPLTITVAYGTTTRTLTVSATGQITFSN
jgi:prepilin-type N-terminal cleavage/methylation domain-containing protein